MDDIHACTHISQTNRAIQGTLTGSSTWEISSPVHAWDWWDPPLPKASLEPKELDSLDSVSMTLCAKFNHTGEDQPLVKDVSPYYSTYKNQINWCNHTSVIQAAFNDFSSEHMDMGVEILKGYVV